MVDAVSAVLIKVRCFKAEEKREEKVGKRKSERDKEGKGRNVKEEGRGRKKEREREREIIRLPIVCTWRKISFSDSA